jgi:quercetin dioxygenase-like cupin family protein
MAAPERERRDPREGMERRQTFRNDGIVVSSIDDNMVLGRAHVPLTEINQSAVILNCYEPGQSDEMHAHPGEDHVFVVYRGRLHLTGVEEGEDLTLEPGQFAHIKAGYYYQLHNPGPDPAVYCQFRTLPAKPPKRRIVFFSESARGKREAEAAR